MPELISQSGCRSLNFLNATLSCNHVIITVAVPHEELKQISHAITLETKVTIDIHRGGLWRGASGDGFTVARAGNHSQ